MLCPIVRDAIRWAGHSALCPYLQATCPGVPAVIVLGIETATDVCAVAVLRDSAVLASASVLVPRSHATRLALLARQALGHARVAPADIGLVAVSAGPGSYTGLRIGASLGRGLGLATGAALVGVGTLDALAAEAAERVGEGEALLVALPSRRGEVYLVGNNGPLRSIETRAVALADLARLVDEAFDAGQPLALAGAAAPDARAALDASGRPLRTVDVRPSAERIARLGLALYVGGTAPGPEAFEPLYFGTFATPPPAR